MSKKRYQGYRLKERFLRALYKICLPKSIRHFVRAFPYLKIDEQSRRVTWKGQVIGQLQMWSQFPSVGTRLIIVGSGPSVTEHLEQLTTLDRQGEPIVLLNGAASLYEQRVIRSPLAVIVEDARFILEKPEIILGLPVESRLVLSTAAFHALCYVDSTCLQKFRIWHMNSVLMPLGKPKPKLADGDFGDFIKAGSVGLSRNLEVGHFGCGTVMYAGIQLGFHLKVAELYLVGFDMTNFEQPRFYETQQNRAWTGLQNSFSNRLLPSLELVRLQAIQQGMEVINCSAVSVIPESLIKKGELPV